MHLGRIVLEQATQMDGIFEVIRITAINIKMVDNQGCWFTKGRTDVWLVSSEEVMVFSCRSSSRCWHRSTMIPTGTAFPAVLWSIAWPLDIRAFFFMMFDFSGEDPLKGRFWSGFAMEGDESAAVEATEGTHSMNSTKNPLCWVFCDSFLAAKHSPSFDYGFFIAVQMMAVAGSESMSAVGFISLSGVIFSLASCREVVAFSVGLAAKPLNLPGWGRLKRLVFSFHLSFRSSWQQWSSWPCWLWSVNKGRWGT